MLGNDFWKRNYRYFYKHSLFFYANDNAWEKKIENSMSKEKGKHIYVC